jgi:hypothetical protein
VRRSSDRRVSRIIYPTTGAHIIRSATIPMMESVDSAISRLAYLFSRHPKRKTNTTARERCLRAIQYICHLAQILDIFMSSCRVRTSRNVVKPQTSVEDCKIAATARILNKCWQMTVAWNPILASQNKVVITAIYGVLSGIWDRF